MSGIVGGAGSKSGVIGQTELDYEEGTWTPSDSHNMTISGTFTGYYVKVGKLITLSWYAVGAATLSHGSNGGTWSSIPFASGTSGASVGHGGMSDGTPTRHVPCAVFNGNNTNIYFSAAITSDTGYNGNISYFTD